MAVNSDNAVGITIGKVRPEYLTIAQVEESEEPYLHKMLHSLAMKYHDKLNESRQTINDAMKMQARTFIIESLVSTKQDRTLIYGNIPVTFDLSGYTIDAKEMASAVVPIDGQNSQKKMIDFSMVYGHEASYQENKTFEDSMFWLSGLSAVKGIQILKSMGIEIKTLEPHQTFVNADISTVVVTDINNALNRGWKVIVPMETGGLPAFPYIKYDEKTGSAGYMIASTAGGFNGFVERRAARQYNLRDNLQPGAGTTTAGHQFCADVSGERHHRSAWKCVQCRDQDAPAVEGRGRRMDSGDSDPRFPYDHSHRPLDFCKLGPAPAVVVSRALQHQL